MTQLLGKDVPITRLYVALCLLVYGATLLDGGGFELLGNMRVSTAFRWGALPAGAAREEPWRLLSPLFLHFGLLHLGFNMMGLVQLGNLLERQLGWARYAVVFLVTVVSGFVVSDVWYTYFADRPALTAGASGGLFGLVGALIGYLYARRDSRWKDITMRFGLYAVLFAVMLPVNNAAHIGGFVVGAPFGYLFYKERRPWRLDRIWVPGATLLILLSFASLFLCQQSDWWRQRRALEQAQPELYQ